jgi:hypothetical protein
MNRRCVPGIREHSRSTGSPNYRPRFEGGEILGNQRLLTRKVRPEMDPEMARP